MWCQDVVIFKVLTFKGHNTRISMKDFPRGGVVILETGLESVEDALKDLNEGKGPDCIGMGWEEVNVALFRCDVEERDSCGMFLVYRVWVI